MNYVPLIDIDSGDKSEHRDLARALLESTGLPVVVPNYRLSPRVPLGVPVENTLKHPIHAQDISLALSAVKGSEHLSSTDLSHLFIIGHSCGAHIISSLLLQPVQGEEIAGDDPLSPEVYDSVEGVILVEGIYDLDLLLKAFPEYLDFVQGAFDDTAHSFSQFCVNRYRVRYGSIATRWLILHSLGDTLVDLPQADAMFNHLLSEYASIGSDQGKIRKDFTTLTSSHDGVLSSPEFVDLVKGMVY